MRKGGSRDIRYRHKGKSTIGDFESDPRQSWQGYRYFVGLECLLQGADFENPPGLFAFNYNHCQRGTNF